LYSEPPSTFPHRTEINMVSETYCFKYYMVNKIQKPSNHIKFSGFERNEAATYMRFHDNLYQVITRLVLQSDTELGTGNGKALKLTR